MPPSPGPVRRWWTRLTTRTRGAHGGGGGGDAAPAPASAAAPRDATPSPPRATSSGTDTPPSSGDDRDARSGGSGGSGGARSGDGGRDRGASSSRSGSASVRDAHPSLDTVLPAAGGGGGSPPPAPPGGKPPLPARAVATVAAPPPAPRPSAMAAFDAARSSFDVGDDDTSSDDDERAGGGAAAAAPPAPAPPAAPPPQVPPPSTNPTPHRTSADSARSAGSAAASSLRSARSSFAVERCPDGDAATGGSSPSSSLGARTTAWLPAGGADPGPVPSLPPPLAAAAAALALTPPDTPLPASLLARLWAAPSPDAAAATADALAGEGVMKVARLADGSVWGLALPRPHAALVAARCGGSASEHEALLLSYAGLTKKEGREEGGGGEDDDDAPDPPASTLAAALAAAPDDGYFQHNVGHHLAAAGRLDALAALVADAGWLDAKLRSYGAAAVTADFRRALAAPPSPATDATRLLLAAFQMAAPAAAAAPGAEGVLAAHMRARLLAAGVDVKASAPPAASPPSSSSSSPPSPPPARGLVPRTPSLEQVGGHARLALRGHTSPVVWCAVAPNGVDVVTAAADGAVRVFDLEVGDCVLHLPPTGGGGGLEAAALDGAGRLLATGCGRGGDGRVRVWDLAGGACVRELGGHGGAAHGVALCAGARTCVTACDDGRVRVFDVEKGVCAAALVGHGGAGVRCVALSPDGRRAVSGGEDFGAVVWDVPARRAAAHLAGHAGWVVAVALAPNGRRVATASADGTARLWDGRTGACERVLAGHAARLSSVLFTADGASVVTASDDGTAAVWSVASGERTAVLAPGGGWVAAAAVAPGGVAGRGVVLLALSNGAVAAHDAGTGARVARVAGHPGGALCASVSARGRFGVTGGADGVARVWDLAAPHPPPPTRRHAGRVHCIAVAAPAGLGAPDRNVVTVGDDGALAWRADGTPLPPLPGGATPTRWARACPAAAEVAVASPDGGLRAWAGPALTAVAGVAGHPGSRVRAFDAAPAAGVALFATYDSAVRVVRYASVPPATLVLQSRGGGPGDGGTGRGHAGVVSARLSADGALAMTASADGTVRLWDTASGRCAHVLAGHRDAAIVCTSLSADGRTLLTVAADGSACVWDCGAGGAPRELAPPGGGAAGGRLAPDGARALLWSGRAAAPDAAAPAAAAAPPSPPRASVWLLATPGPPVRVAHADAPSGGVSATAWSADGALVALGSPDGTLRALRAADGAPLGFFMADAAVTAAAFAGGSLVAGCEDGSVHFLDVGDGGE